MEAMRCLKRRLSDIVYRTMLGDFVTGRVTGPGGQRGDDSGSSAAGSQPHTGSSDKPLPGPATTQPRTPPCPPRLDTEGSHERAYRLLPWSRNVGGGRSVADSISTHRTRRLADTCFVRVRWWSCCRGRAAGSTPMWSGGQRHAVRAMPSRGDFDRAWRSKALRQSLQRDHGCRSRNGWNRHNRRRLRGHGDSRRRRVPSAWRPCSCLPTPTLVAAAAARVRPLITGPLLRRERVNGGRSVR
jgi:hypothetical protein